MEYPIKQFSIGGSDIFDDSDRLKQESKNVNKNFRKAFGIYKTIFDKILQLNDDKYIPILQYMTKYIDNSLHLYKVLINWTSITDKMKLPQQIINSQDFRDLTSVCKELGQSRIPPKVSTLIESELRAMEGKIKETFNKRQLAQKSTLRENQYNTVLKDILKNTPEENSRILKIIYEEELRKEKDTIFKLQVQQGDQQMMIEVVKQYYNFRKQCIGKVSEFCSDVEKKLVQFIKDFKVGDIQQYQKKLQVQFTKFKNLIQNQQQLKGGFSEQFSEGFSGGTTLGQITDMASLKEYIKTVSQESIKTYINDDNKYGAYMLMVKEMAGIKLDEKDILSRLILPSDILQKFNYEFVKSDKLQYNADLRSDVVAFNDIITSVRNIIPKKGKFSEQLKALKGWIEGKDNDGKEIHKPINASGSPTDVQSSFYHKVIITVVRNMAINSLITIKDETVRLMGDSMKSATDKVNAVKAPEGPQPEALAIKKGLDVLVLFRDVYGNIDKGDTNQDFKELYTVIGLFADATDSTKIDAALLDVNSKIEKAKGLLAVYMNALEQEYVAATVKKETPTKDDAEIDDWLKEEFKGQQNYIINYLANLNNIVKDYIANNDWDKTSKSITGLYDIYKTNVLNNLATYNNHTTVKNFINIIMFMMEKKVGPIRVYDENVYDGIKIKTTFAGDHAPGTNDYKDDDAKKDIITYGNLIKAYNNDLKDISDITKLPKAKIQDNIDQILNRIKQKDLFTMLKHYQSKEDIDREGGTQLLNKIIGITAMFQLNAKELMDNNKAEQILIDLDIKDNIARQELSDLLDKYIAYVAYVSGNHNKIAFKGGLSEGLHANLSDGLSGGLSEGLLGGLSEGLSPDYDTNKTIHKLSQYAINSIFSTIMIQLEKFTADNQQQSFVSIISNNFVGGEQQGKIIQGAEMFYQMFIKVAQSTYARVESTNTTSSQFTFYMTMMQNSKFREPYLFVITKVGKEGILQYYEFMQLVQILNPIWQQGNGDGDYKNIQSGINQRTKNLIQNFIDEMMEGMSYQLTSSIKDYQYNMKDLGQVADLPTFEDISKATGFQNNIKLLGNDLQKESGDDVIDNILDTIPDEFRTMNDKYSQMIESLEKMVNEQTTKTGDIRREKDEFMYYMQRYYTDPNYIESESREQYVYNKYTKFQSEGESMIIDDGVERFTEMFGLMLSYYMIYSSNIMKVLYKYHTDYVDKVISIEKELFTNGGAGSPYEYNVSTNHKLSLVLALVCSMNSDEKSLQKIYLKITNLIGGTNNNKSFNTLNDYAITLNDLLVEKEFIAMTTLQKFNYLMLFYGDVSTGKDNNQRKAEYVKYVKDYKQMYDYEVDQTNITLTALWKQYQYVLNDQRVQQSIILAWIFSSKVNILAFYKKVVEVDQLSTYFKQITTDSTDVGELVITVQHDDNAILSNTTGLFQYHKAVSSDPPKKYYLNTTYYNILKKWYYPPFIYPLKIEEQPKMIDTITSQLPLVQYNDDRFDCQKLCQFLQQIEQKILSNYDQFASDDQQVRAHYYENLKQSLNFSTLINAVFKYKMIAPVSMQTIKNELKQFYRTEQKEEIQYSFSKIAENRYDSDIYSIQNARMVEQQTGAMAGIEKAQTFMSKQLHVDSLTSTNYNDLIESIKTANAYMRQCIDIFSLDGRLQQLPMNIQSTIINNSIIQDQMQMDAIPYKKYTINIPTKAFQTPFTLPEIQLNKAKVLDKSYFDMEGGAITQGSTDVPGNVEHNVRGQSFQEEFYKQSDILMVNWLLSNDKTVIEYDGGGQDTKVMELFGEKPPISAETMKRYLDDKDKEGQLIIYGRMIILLSKCSWDSGKLKCTKDKTTMDTEIETYVLGRDNTILQNLLKEPAARNRLLEAIYNEPKDDAITPGTFRFQKILGTNFDVQKNQRFVYQNMGDQRYNAINGWIKEVLMNINDGHTAADHGRTNTYNLDGITTNNVATQSFAGDNMAVLDDANTRIILAAINSSTWPKTIDKVKGQTKFTGVGYVSIFWKQLKLGQDITFEYSNDVLYRFDKTKAAADKFVQIEDIQNITSINLRGITDILNIEDSIVELANRIKANEDKKEGADKQDSDIMKIAKFIATNPSDQQFSQQTITYMRSQIDNFVRDFITGDIPMKPEGFLRQNIDNGTAAPARSDMFGGAKDFKRVLYCMFLRTILQYQLDMNPIFQTIALMKDIEIYMTMIQRQQLRNPIFFGLTLEQFIRQCINENQVYAPSITLVKYSHINDAEQFKGKLSTVGNDSIRNEYNYAGVKSNGNGPLDDNTHPVLASPLIQMFDIITCDKNSYSEKVGKFVQSAKKNFIINNSGLLGGDQTDDDDDGPHGRLQGGLRGGNEEDIIIAFFGKNQYNFVVNQGGWDHARTPISNQTMVIEVSYKYSNPFIRKLAEKQRDQNIEHLLLDQMAQLYIYDQRKAKITQFNIATDNNQTMQKYAGQLLFIPIIYALSKYQNYDYTLEERRKILSRIVSHDVINDIDKKLRYGVFSDATKQILSHLKGIYKQYVVDNFKLYASNKVYQNMYRHYMRQYEMAIAKPDQLLKVDRYIQKTAPGQLLDEKEDNLMQWMTIESMYGEELSKGMVKYREMKDQSMFKQLWLQLLKLNTVDKIQPQVAKLLFTRRIGDNLVGVDHYYGTASKAKVLYPTYNTNIVFSGKSSNQHIDFINMQQIYEIEKYGVDDLQSALYQWIYYSNLGLENKKTLNLLKGLYSYQRSFRDEDNNQLQHQQLIQIRDSNITTSVDRINNPDYVQLYNPFIYKNEEYNVGTLRLGDPNIIDKDLYLTNLYYRYAITAASTNPLNATPFDISFDIRMNAGITEDEIKDTSSTLGLLVCGETNEGGLKDYLGHLKQIFKNLPVNGGNPFQYQANSMDKIFRIVQLNPINPLSLIKRSLSFPIINILGLYMYKYIAKSDKMKNNIDFVNYNKTEGDKPVRSQDFLGIIKQNISIVIDKMKTQRNIGKNYNIDGYRIAPKRDESIQLKDKMREADEDMFGIE